MKEIGLFETNIRFVFINEEKIAKQLLSLFVRQALESIGAQF